jgi:hypothetical protein
VTLRMVHFPWGAGRRLVGTQGREGEWPARARAMFKDLVPGVYPPPAFTTAYMNTSSAAGPQSLIWAGALLVAGFANGVIETSADGGESWSFPTWQTAMPEVPWKGAAENGVGIVLLASDGFLARSTNDGGTFTSVFLGTFRLAGIVFHDGAFHVFTVDGNVYRSANGGFDWEGPTPIDIAPAWTFWQMALDMQEPIDSTLGLLGAVFVNAAGRIGIRTSQNGLNWATP